MQTKNIAIYYKKLPFVAGRFSISENAENINIYGACLSLEQEQYIIPSKKYPLAYSIAPKFSNTLGLTFALPGYSLDPQKIFEFYHFLQSKIAISPNTKTYLRMLFEYPEQFFAYLFGDYTFSLDTSENRRAQFYMQRIHRVVSELSRLNLWQKYCVYRGSVADLRKVFGEILDIICAEYELDKVHLEYSFAHKFSEQTKKIIVEIALNGLCSSYEISNPALSNSRFHQ